MSIASIIVALVGVAFLSGGDMLFAIACFVIAALVLGMELSHPHFNETHPARNALEAHYAENYTKTRKGWGWFLAIVTIILVVVAWPAIAAALNMAR